MSTVGRGIWQEQAYLKDAFGSHLIPAAIVEAEHRRNALREAEKDGAEQELPVQDDRNRGNALLSRKAEQDNIEQEGNDRIREVNHHL